MNPAVPVAQEDRISSLDVLRGIAVLGILLMNIVGFGLYANSYSNPHTAGGATGVNLWMFCLNSVLVDGKMRGIFSLLFGAGILLFTDRMEEKGLGIRGAEIYFRRLLWLGLIGIAHAFLLWWGEILYPYAIAGLILFPFRSMRPKGLMIFAGVLIAIMSAFICYDAFDTRKVRDEAMRYAAMQKQGRTLTEEQEKTRKRWEDSWNGHYPKKDVIEKDRKAFATNFITAIPRRAELVTPWHNMAAYSPKNWDVMMMMLLGIALLKNGFLTGALSVSTYARVAILGYLIGLPPAIWAAWNMVRYDFDIVASGFSFAVYEPSRIAVCLAHTAVVLIVLKSGALAPLFGALRAAGQMAFTNYLMQSVLCTTFFTGLHYYGRLERHQLYFVVAGIWVLELIWSPLWLRHYRFGPLEWCWRSLTYWKRQPMRLDGPEPPATGGADESGEAGPATA
jgi:uncharacterized protein